MGISDLDVYRSANLWIGQHGALAVTKARDRVASLQATGDRDGADAWLRIIIAIETLQQPPPPRLS